MPPEVPRDDAVEFLIKPTSDDMFIGALCGSLFVEIFQNTMQQCAVIGRVDFASVGIERLQTADLGKIKPQRALEVMFETGNTDSGDGIRALEMKFPSGRRLGAAAPHGGRLENFVHARGKFRIGATEEETRRTVRFAVGTEPAVAETETRRTVVAQQTGEQIGIASVAGGIRGEAEFRAQAVGQKRILVRSGRQGSFAATRDANDKGVGPRCLEPTSDFDFVRRRRQENSPVFEVATTQGVAHGFGLA